MITKNKTVQVVDCMPGAGKSTWAIEYMKANPDRKWMFVSPYIDQVGDDKTKGRIPEALPELCFKSPSDKSKKKSDDLEDLLRAGQNVSITHSLFNRITQTSLEQIHDQEYHLIIDEVVDCISKYDLEKIPVDDIHGMIKADILQYSEDNHKLTWNPEIPVLSVYKEIKELCDREELYFYKQHVLIQRSSTKVIKQAKSVTVMTYLFETSFMSYWLKMNGVDWEYIYPQMKNSNESLKENLRQNLVILDIPRKIQDMQVTTYKGIHTQFSASWYKNNKERLEQIRRSMETVMRKQFRDKSLLKEPKVFWTTFKAYRDDLAGHGYTLGNANCEADGTFIASNIRASNEYADRNCCLYTVNVFPHMDIVRYINLFGIEVDADGYALSQIIQFIYRGAIRKDNKMLLCIFSKRMKSILEEWLYSD